MMVKTTSDNFIESKNNQIEQLQMDYVAETIKIPYRTIKQMIEYLIVEHGAIPCELTETQKRVLKANVIMLHFPEVLEKPFLLPINPTRKQLVEYAQKDTSHIQAMNYSQELGLIFSSYVLPDTGVIVEMEITTQYFHCRNDNGQIMDELTLWKGIEKSDIDARSPRFRAYVKLLKAAGKLL